MEEVGKEVEEWQAVPYYSSPGRPFHVTGHERYKGLML